LLENILVINPIRKSAFTPVLSPFQRVNCGIACRSSSVESPHLRTAKRFSSKSNLRQSTSTSIKRYLALALLPLVTGATGPGFNIFERVFFEICDLGVYLVKNPIAGGAFLLAMVGFFAFFLLRRKDQ
jgi:hypothetical protein